MTIQTRFKVFGFIICLILVCAVCLAAGADNDFDIKDKTLVKYNGPGGEVTVPEGIEKLDVWAFKNTKVTKVNLPETLKEIESFCFFGCHELTDITLPASLRLLEYGQDGIENSQIFAFNSSLKEIKVAEGNPYYKSVDGVLFTADGKKLLYYPDGKGGYGEYAIPEGTEELGYSPFGSASVTSIHIPSTLQKIGDYEDNPFTAITSLKEITVSPENKRYYSKNGIMYAENKLICYPAAKPGKGLTKEIFPEGVTWIGDEAFACNENLVHVELPEGIEKVGRMGFVGSWNLESITIPASVTEIRAYAFHSCHDLKKVVILNPEVKLPDNDFLEEKDRENNKYIITENSEKAVLYGYENSTTQAYAEKWGLKFKSLGPVPEK